MLSTFHLYSSLSFGVSLLSYFFYNCCNIQVGHLLWSDSKLQSFVQGRLLLESQSSCTWEIWDTDLLPYSSLISGFVIANWWIFHLCFSLFCCGSFDSLYCQLLFCVRIHGYGSHSLGHFPIAISLSLVYISEIHDGLQVLLVQFYWLKYTSDKGQCPTFGLQCLEHKADDSYLPLSLGRQQLG